MSANRPVHVLLVHQPRPPLRVDPIRLYSARRHGYWRHAGQMLQMNVSVVAADEVVARAQELEKHARPIVWFDLPPLPPADHEQLCEELWGQGITALEPPQAFLNAWDISCWYPRLQGVFVRQPPTAIVPTTPGTDFSDPATVAVLERTLRAVEPLGGVKKGVGAREILRPFFGWSPLFDLEGMAPWEGAAAANLRRFGPFLVQQQENWELPVGGVALQYLPPHLPDIPVVRVYVIGGAPIWWSVRSHQLRGEAANSFRLWADDGNSQVLSALYELATTIGHALGAQEFVFETAAVPNMHLFDVRPLNAVFEPANGAHLATVICLAAYLKGVALGESSEQALAHMPTYADLVDAMETVSHSPQGHGPFNIGPAHAILQPPTPAAQGAGPTPAD